MTEVRTSDSLVIAIDGPAGAGKSTVARRVATALGLRYLDTGAMYRAATLWVLQHHVDLSQPSEIEAAVADAVAVLDVVPSPTDPQVRLAEVDVAERIRGPEVTATVSLVSAIPGVRRLLVARQREIIDGGGIVVEGRDIGSVVCPNADVKIFLTADAAVRAARRFADGESFHARDVAAVDADLRRRDRLDAERHASPLAVAPDAVVLDTTDMDLDAVVCRILQLVRAADQIPAEAWNETECSRDQR